MPCLICASHSPDWSPCFSTFIGEYRHPYIQLGSQLRVGIRAQTRKVGESVLQSQVTYHVRRDFPKEYYVKDEGSQISHCWRMGLRYRKGNSKKAWQVGSELEVLMWIQNFQYMDISSVQFSRSVVSNSATPWTAAHQASLGDTGKTGKPGSCSSWGHKKSVTT